ncbi:class I SAM-dependent methyltransferase [Ideonella sp. 4Y16]|uniref:class I SAM-dependent methyltransferase n=1 Tax=Ideonella alba TaxID=2824118 RepID=UPI001B37E0FF|nr:class I SAM-dependent methyltransferase [Ideonella alba]MBQ0942281.1 class I SAM-dependent methyltransferase [Ideonella alba]
MNLSTVATADTAVKDSYGTATCISSEERQRMNVQFALHTLPLLGRALQTLGGPSGLRVTDVGSGYGASVAAFEAPHGLPRQLSLMDCNASLLAHAQARAKQIGVVARTYLGAVDATPMPPELQPQDLVLCSFTATHLHDLGAGLRHMVRALRPGGLLVLTDVDYCASLAGDSEAAQDCLWWVQQKLVVRDLSSALPRLALQHGLRPVPGIECSDTLHTYTGEAARQLALGFVRHFHADDPAKAAWRRIGPEATVVLRRMAHLYRRA